MAFSETILPSASRTTTQTSPDIDTRGARSLTLTVDITVIGTGSITATINRKDPTSGKYVLMLASAALVANATTLLKITPGEIAAAANAVAVDVMPEFIQIVVTANNANPVTYSVGLDLEDQVLE